MSVIVTRSIQFVPSLDDCRYAVPDADLVDDQNVMTTREMAIAAASSYCSQPKPSMALNAVSELPSKAFSGDQLS